MGQDKNQRQDNNYGNAWNNTKQHIICHNCSQPGHYANQCTKNQQYAKDSLAPLPNQNQFTASNKQNSNTWNQTKNHFDNKFNRNNSTHPNNGQNNFSPYQNGNKYQQNSNRSNFTPQNNNQNNFRPPQENRTIANNKGIQQGNGAVEDLFQQISGMSIEPQVNVIGHEDLPYFGIHLTCEAEAGQFKCRSLIDSGAQPSIMSLKRSEMS